MTGVDKQESLRTGIDILDRKLGDGIPAGTVTVLSADPASQSELFLYEFAATHETVYLSTIRTVETIVDLFEQRGVDTDSVDIVRLDNEDPVGHAETLIGDLNGANVVIDPIDVLETTEPAHCRRFLSELKQRSNDTGAVTFLHCLRDDPIPANRRNTLHVADLVFRLTTETKGDSIENRLAVPKFRHGQAVEETIKLDMTSEVEVDLSRNIL